MTKIATTREQGRRLMACGVKADTADMCRDMGTEELSLIPYKDSSFAQSDEPAWSLSRLLEMMPEKIGEIEGLECLIQLKREKDDDGRYSLWELSYYDVGVDYTFIFIEDADAINACVWMIEWLTQNCYELNKTEDR